MGTLQGQSGRIDVTKMAHWLRSANVAEMLKTTKEKCEGTCVVVFVVVVVVVVVLFVCLFDYVYSANKQQY